MKDYPDLPEYVLMNPTGNITVLVTAPVAPDRRKIVADAIMANEPLAEQLGFVNECETADIRLEMAGGEFCGNASMCAAAFYASKEGLVEGSVLVSVSGTPDPVNVAVKNMGDSWECCVEMPQPVKIDTVTFPDKTEFPVVHFHGIDHIICCIDDRTKIDGNSVKEDSFEIHREVFETKIKEYCKYLGSVCCGIMLYNRKDHILDPLVYVPGADTLFWESSCASGTTAIGAWEHINSCKDISLSLKEPGGQLKIESSGNKLLLSGTVRKRN